VKSLFFAFWGILGLATLAQAAPLDRTEIAAQAKWLAHIDFDAARAAKVAGRVYDEWLSHGMADRALREVRKTIGLNLLEDVRGITFYGVRYQASSGVVLVRAKVDEARLMEILKANATHRVEPHGDHALHTWIQKVDAKHKGEVTGCFYRPNLVVVGRDIEEVKAAVQVLDGKSPNLAAGDSVLNHDAPKATVFLGGAIGLTGLAGQRLPFVSPLVRHADYVLFGLGEDEGEVRLRVRLGVASADVAGRLRDIFVGFRAPAALARDDDPEMIDALDALRISSEGHAVLVDWRMPGEKVMRLLEREWAKRRGTN